MKIKIELWLMIIGITILLFCGVGYVKNVIKLIGCDFEAPYKCEVVHTVGIFPIVGAFTGWISIEENKND